MCTLTSAHACLFYVWLAVQGPGTCDHTPLERTINLVTSLPFFVLGLQTFRHAFRRARSTLYDTCRAASHPCLGMLVCSRDAKSDESRLYGASVMGVGAGALTFHATSGPARNWGRKLDYWMIALSTAALNKVLHPSVSRHRTGASLLLTPMQPLAVTSANTIGMEVWRAMPTSFRMNASDWHRSLLAAMSLILSTFHCSSHATTWKCMPAA